MTAPQTLTCQEVEELAGLYVLDALEPREAQAVAEHLAVCPQTHAIYADLAATASSLSMTVPEVAPPADLRDRLMAAVAATPQVPDLPTVAPSAATPTSASLQPWPVEYPSADSLPAAVPREPRPAPSARGARSGWAWLGMAAVLVALVFVSTGILGTLQRDAGRADLFRRAVAAAADPASNVAVLTGTDAAAGANGYAVFPEGQDGFLVIDGLPSIGAQLAYQAWFVGDGDPVSAGLIELSRDGLGTLTDLELAPGTVAVAVTVEERPGAAAPTGTPLFVGELPTATA